MELCSCPLKPDNHQKRGTYRRTTGNFNYRKLREGHTPPALTVLRPARSDPNAPRFTPFDHWFGIKEGRPTLPLKIPDMSRWCVQTQWHWSVRYRPTTDLPKLRATNYIPKQVLERLATTYNSEKQTWEMSRPLPGGYDITDAAGCKIVSNYDTTPVYIAGQRAIARPIDTRESHPITMPLDEMCAKLRQYAPFVKQDVMARLLETCRFTYYIPIYDEGETPVTSIEGLDLNWYGDSKPSFGPYYVTYELEMMRYGHKRTYCCVTKGRRSRTSRPWRSKSEIVGAELRESSLAV